MLPSAHVIRRIASPTLWCIASLLNAQTWDVFDMNSAGFPSNTVTDIAVDSQDNVWVGTDFGLCKYDGTNWTIYQDSNSGLPDNLINTLSIDSLDRLWIGTVLHGVVVYDGSTWQNYNTLNSPLPDNEIKCITLDYRGWAWIGTYVGLACFTGQEWRIYNDSDTSYAGLRLNGNVIEDVAVRPDGLVAVGTLNYGFHYLTDTSVFVYASYFNLFPDNTQTGVAIDTVHDERWLTCPAGGLLRQGGDWHGGPWFQYTTQNSGIPTNTLLCITMDDEGLPWMGGSLAGVIRRNANGSFTTFTTANSDLPDNTIPTLAFAHNGDLWVGTYYGGAARLRFTTAQRERSGGPDVTAYPVPTDDHVHVQWGWSNGPVQWELHDPQGRQLSHGEAARSAAIDIDLGDYAAGGYLLRSHDLTNVAVTRLVKR